MSEIKLYIATTIDGYIARKDGSLDWLNEIPNPDQTDYGYRDFLSTIGTVIMGRKTYEEILGFGVEWPYPDCGCYIVTSARNYGIKTINTSIISQLDKATVMNLIVNSRKDTWVVGGGQVITQFIDLGLIDEMILSIIPVILGKGIKLFPGEPKETRFELVKTEAFQSGVTNLTYKKK